MKTKIIPFDAKMAKYIQDGKIKGKIKTEDGEDVLIVVWNKKDEDGYVILAIVDKPGTDLVISYTCNGKASKGRNTELDLVLEVPDTDAKECEFKPFDRVLVRGEGGFWMARLYDRYYLDRHWCQDGICWKYCIPYEGNENLVGTTNKPKEE